MEHIKELKKLARGKAPANSPGHYSDSDVVVGRDGQQWRTHRVYFDYNGEERYELVWTLAN
jgi:hypothetical protein